MVAQLKAEKVKLPDPWAFLEQAYEHRWTDGLPILPPTPDKVAAILDYLGRNPREKIGNIPPRQGVANIESIAIHCAMAACKPAYVPVVIAAYEAMLGDVSSDGGTTGTMAGRRFNLNGVQCTTCHCGPIAIVTGSIVKALGFNTGKSVFNAGHANVTIGRAIRLLLWNVGGAYSGEIDMATLGHPGKLAYCIAESTDACPWPPYHVDKGFTSEQNVVSCVALDAPHDCYVGPAKHDPYLMMGIVADVCAQLGPLSWHVGDEMHQLIVLSPLVANELARHDWTRRDVQQFLFDYARRPMKDLKFRIGRTGDDFNWPKWLDISNPETRVPVTRRVEEFQVIVAGGDNDWWAAVCPSWGGHGGWTVHAEVKLPRKSS